MPKETTLAGVLELDSVVTGYGKKQVLHGVSLDVASGEIVAVVGHNGAGKSTVLRAIFGLLPIWRGHVRVKGLGTQGLSPRALLRAGVAYVPQGNRVFAGLTVRENLEMGGATLANGTAVRSHIDGVLALFPRLGQRLGQRAGTLSGGEKQMLALASALVVSPSVLLLDEPSLGLAPPLVTETLQHLKGLSGAGNVAVLIVEQKVREVLKVAHRVLVLRNGAVSFWGTAEALRNDTTLARAYL